MKNVEKAKQPLVVYILAIGIVLSFVFTYVMTNNVKDTVVGEVTTSRNGNLQGRAIVQKCISGLLFVTPEHRAELSDQKVADICGMSIEDVRQARDLAQK